MASTSMTGSSMGRSSRSSITTRPCSSRQRCSLNAQLSVVVGARPQQHRQHDRHNARAVRVHSQQHAHQHDHQSAPQLSTSRRQLLLASTAAWQLAFTTAPPAHAAAPSPSTGAAAAATCQQLQQAPSGMRWCDVVVGEGQLAIKGSFTKLDYTAKLASTGAVFDSTYQRRQPLIFKVGEHELIEAFDVAVLGDEGVPPMREGGRRRLVVPPGPLQRQGVKSLTWVTGLIDAIDEAGETISPDGSFNSVLEFEIELVPKRRRA